MREVILAAFFFLLNSCAAAPQLLQWPKVMSQEGTYDTSAMSLNYSPGALLRRDCSGYLRLRSHSSTQDGDLSWAAEVVPSATASQGTSGGKLFLWR